MGVGRIFSRGANNDEISFYPLENTKTNFFAKNLMRKYKISKSRGWPWRNGTVGRRRFGDEM